MDTGTKVLLALIAAALWYHNLFPPESIAVRGQVDSIVHIEGTDRDHPFRIEVPGGLYLQNSSVAVTLLDDKLPPVSVEFHGMPLAVMTLK